VNNPKSLEGLKRDLDLTKIRGKRTSNPEYCSICEIKFGKI